MSTEEPELQDFGITSEEYALYKGKGEDVPTWFQAPWLQISIIVLSVAVGGGFIVTQEVVDFVDFSVGGILAGAFSGLFALAAFSFGAWFVISLVVAISSVPIAGPIMRFKRSRLLASPVASRIERYERARAAYTEAQQEVERQQREAERIRQEAAAREREREWERQEAERMRLRKITDYWMSLNGAEFERELAALCRNMGYSVQSTPSSGDQGVDLILNNPATGKTIVVQCKSHKAPVGPAIARELYGSLIHSRADSAVLACTGGFTRGVYEFVRGKPIALVSASDLATLGGGRGIEAAAGRQRQLWL